jgi:predicted regulator of Ras-like GTPase activity (Roadblock/LC7/MglB family)
MSSDPQAAGGACRYPAVAPETVAAVRFLLDQIVTGVPGVSGALVSTIDGFAVADRLVLPPPSAGAAPTDAAGLAAMTAAFLGIANRMVAALGQHPAAELTASSAAGHIVVCRVGSVAALTVVCGTTSNLGDVEVVAREVASGLARLLLEPRATTTQWAAPDPSATGSVPATV